VEGVGLKGHMGGGVGWKRQNTVMWGRSPKLLKNRHMIFERSLTDYQGRIYKAAPNPPIREGAPTILGAQLTLNNLLFLM